MNKGLVYKSTGSRYKLRKEDGEFIEAVITGKLRLKGTRGTNPVTVGDWVEYEVENSTDMAVIKKVHERKNYIIRRSSNLSKEYHIIAANIDQCFLVVTLFLPGLKLEFIDRFLVTAEAYQVPVILVFNKVDLYNSDHMDDLNEIISIYDKAGYESIKTSSRKGTNLDILKEKMKNKVNLFSGNSGVGKSSIINSIDTGLKLKTSTISYTNQTGKHTTTYAEMHELPFGGFIIDTPGIKGFGLIDIDKNELYHFFPEIFRYSESCKFHNCLHVNEPGCAVKKFVDQGEIPLSRYNNYLSILLQDEERYR